MKASPFDRFKHSNDDIFKILFNATFLTGYGFVHKVIDADTVIVRIAYKVGTAETLLQCTYLVPSNAMLEVDTTATEGDKVLVIALQHHTPDMFTADDVLSVDSLSGYGIMTGVAIPYGTRKAASKINAQITKDLAKADTELPVEINLKSLKINGDGNHFVTWEELQNVLTPVETALKQHTHPATEGSTSPSAELASISLDISKAKTPNLETGDK